MLADFWFNHFNVFWTRAPTAIWSTDYERDAIRPHVLGKFRDMLRRDRQDPAMLFYLDNWQSVATAQARRCGRARRPGAGNAAQQLQRKRPRPERELRARAAGTAHARRGWRLHPEGRDRSGALLHRMDHQSARSVAASSSSTPRMHDDGEKMVLGVTIPAGGGIEDGREVLDIVARHPSTAKFISRKLAQRFVADEPPAGAGGPHGADVPQDRWRHPRGDADA